MTTPREHFRSQYTPGTPYQLDGALINKQARILEGVGLQTGGAYTNVVQGQDVPPPPPGAFGIATITDASNTCGAGDTEIAAPCNNVNKYLAHFRYYDTSANVWIDYDEDLRLDASGYWEGIATPVAYVTNASKSPTSGPGYGAIPAYVEGEQVPCIFDNKRGWLIPIQGAPDQQPGGEMYSSAVLSIPEEGVEPNNCVILSFDVYTPARGAWKRMQQTALRIPEENLYEWLDTIQLFVIFRAPSTQAQPTYYRIRLGKHSDYGVSIWEARMRVFGIGRASSVSYFDDKNVRESLEDGKGRWHNSGWSIQASIPGRFKDSPTFTVSNQGLMAATYLDPQDDWFCAAQVEVTVANEPPEFSSTSQSDVSSSTYLSLSSLSPSSQSSQSSFSSTRSWTSATSQTSTSSGTATSTSSTHLQSTSTSESSTRTGTSETSGLGYCTVTLVSDVECDEDGRVIRVCYRTIAIPSLADGTPCSEQIGPEVCYPCERETSFSSPSLSQLTSTSSTHLQTTSTSTSSVNSSSSTRLQTSSQSSQTTSQGTSSLGVSSGTSSLGISTGTSDVSSQSTSNNISTESIPIPSSISVQTATNSTFPIDETQMQISDPP